MREVQKKGYMKVTSDYPKMGFCGEKTPGRPPGGAAAQASPGRICRHDHRPDKLGGGPLFNTGLSPIHFTVGRCTNSVHAKVGPLKLLFLG